MQISREIITSRQNKAVSLLASLESRKARQREGLFRFDGVKLLSEAIGSGLDIRYVFLKESGAERLLSDLCQGINGKGETRVLILSDSLFDRVSEEQGPEGVMTVAVCPPIHCRGSEAESALQKAASGGGRIMLLESVRDPGNVGTIFRSALAFGLDLLVMSEDCADLLAPKTVRGAMGALFRLPTARFSELGEAVALLRGAGRTVLGAALDREAMPLGVGRLGRGDCVVIGNEGHGLSPALLGKCDKKLFIPMEPRSESLNAAVAASVILWSMYTI